MESRYVESTTIRWRYEPFDGAIFGKQQLEVTSCGAPPERICPFMLADKAKRLQTTLPFARVFPSWSSKRSEGADIRIEFICLFYSTGEQCVI